MLPNGVAVVKAFQESHSRVYGPVPAAAFVVGTVVGTGIYLKPGLVAALLEYLTGEHDADSERGTVAADAVASGI